jgi:hypothetical protein
VIDTRPSTREHSWRPSGGRGVTSVYVEVLDITDLDQLGLVAEVVPNFA